MSHYPAQIYDQLFAYCKAENFAGYDPFDGLNSRYFRLSPFNRFALARLAWLQTFKRLPFDLRSKFGIDKGVNPKGIALFALAELSRFRAEGFDEHAKNAKDLIEKLLEHRIEGTTIDGRATTAFGYNFDWQSRVFYAPLGTPTIVPTVYAAQALIEAYELFDEDRYLTVAEEICGFITTGLNRPVETEDELCFSYTPLDRSVIFNASLLAGECLARVGVITSNEEYLALAAKTARFVIRRQRQDGAWAYGDSVRHKWVDSFHTAYILLSLFRISGQIPALRSETHDAIKLGAGFWLDNFFLEDGTPKYYDTSVYPIDIHSAAVAIATLCELKPIDERMMPMARKTAEWTMANMRGPEGLFYYQKRKSQIIKIPYLRWAQAWMSYALARIIETESELSRTS